MGRSLRRLWSVPAYLPYVQSELTTQAIRAAEQQFAVALPAAYLSMLAEQNGGYLRATWPDLPHRGLAGVGPKFPSLTADAAWWRASDAAGEMWVPSNADRLVPFDGDGHWNLCWDYRTTGPHAEPAVTYIDIETGDDVQVAASFDTFLNGLVDEVESTALRIVADVSLDEFGQILAAVNGFELHDQGDWNHGYRQLRARLGDGQWMWVSPNQVPAGFHRDGHRIVATPETALRLPDDPACRIIVKCTPTLRRPPRPHCGPPVTGTANM